MPDVKDFAPNNPVHQTESPQPKYKTLFFQGGLEDDKEDWIPYAFNGDYFEFNGVISFVKAEVVALYTDTPIIPQDEIKNILRIDIREQLNTDYSIIFETKIELK